MNTKFCWIILRDLPKKKAQIDTDVYEIEGSFRGFKQVISGLHYVGVKVDQIYQGFWSYLEPNEVLVKVFNHTSQQFEDDEPETTAHYQKLALGGAMDHVLIPYEHDSGEIWEKLTNHIHPPVFSPILRNAAVNIPVDNPSDLLMEQRKSRFEQTLFNQHGGDIEAFLSELQFAFVRWYAHEDIEALNRWNYLLQAVYNASEFGIAKAPKLFSSLIDILLAQFDCFPQDMFTPNSFVTAQANYLAEDMIDSDIDGIVEKGQDFEAYLQKRGVLSD
ncbi:AAR2 pre-mRNA splicing protein [Nodularia sp. LEGE 06071]|nr:AAR2 pre-mRNA splicing protein [Nodularia sp. LEGE 06071]MCC2693349.1 AAR2 pre-mRNA splicing protein [Nodularia sp. LEGE 04288]